MSNHMEFSAILKAAGDESYSGILRKLIRPGLSREALDSAIAELLEKGVDDPVVSISRMNLIGGLRAAGYVVSGGRHGGEVYQIMEWIEKPVKPTVDEWVGESKSVFDWLHNEYPLVTEAWFPIVYHQLELRRPVPFHESCWLYPWAYEGARTEIRYLPGAFVIQKFKNYPRFKIFDLHSTPRELLALAEIVSKASMKPVPIIHIHPDHREAFNELHPGGSWGHREEAIYDASDIAANPELYLNKRAMSTLRARIRDTTFGLTTNPEDDLLIIKHWRKLNEKKHRQLAITRDIIAIESEAPSKISFTGYREDVPVVHHLFDRHPATPNMVSLINEKALNYSTFEDGSPVPGGKYGLSDYNQVMACQALVDMGIQFIQSGGIDGGGVGLPDKKRKYAVDFISSETFYTSFPLSEYA